MSAPILLASSSTIENLLQLIREFYACTNLKRIELKEDGVIFDNEANKEYPHVRWIKKGKRFRFEKIN